MASGDDPVVTHDDERLWFGLRRRHWKVVAYLALAIAQVVSLTVDNQRDEDRRHKDEQEQVDDDFLACVRGNQQRQVLRLVVSQAYTSSGSQTFDVTTLPEWQSVVDQDPAVAALLAILLQPREGGSIRAEQVLALIPPDRDCDAAFPTHTRGIENRVDPTEVTTTTSTTTTAPPTPP